MCFQERYNTKGDSLAVRFVIVLTTENDDKIMTNLY